MEDPATGRITCPTCKTVFTSRQYYNSHFQYPANLRCKAARNSKLVAKTPRKRPIDSDFEDSDEDSVHNRARSLKDALFRKNFCLSKMMDSVFKSQEIVQNTEETHVMLEEESSDGGEIGMFDNDFDDDEEFEEEEEASEAEEEVQPDPDEKIKEEFTKYCDHQIANATNSLSPEMEAGIELMSLLINTRAPLHLYNKIFKWHVNNIKAKEHKPKRTLMKDLAKRYNLSNKGPSVIRDLQLPHSESRINLVVHKFREQVQSLLSDPRIEDEDYLFFNDDPFAPPPKQFTTVGDINTGLAYRKSYDELITIPNRQVLLPIIWYLDGAVTGMYDHLPIEALKFTVGILNSRARDKAFVWKNLGYVTKFLGEETEAKDIVRESSHMDADCYVSDVETWDSDEEFDNLTRTTASGAAYSDDEEEEEEEEVNEEDLEPKIPACSAQDTHTMLETMLASYRELEHGFDWDLRYKGKTYQVTFVPFVMFIKGDTKEHDMHCGKYQVRTGNVANLCRYCCCPTNETDNPHTKNKAKTQPMIQKLIDNEDTEALQEISQHRIVNCWYSIRFGQHNNHGVHGACPLDLLHWMNINKYKYLRGMFFEQTGKDTALSKRINTLARSLGYLYKRQSDRDKARTDFSAKGVKKGKLMGHEMSGLLLILVTCFRTAKGRNMLLTESRGAQKQYFGTPELIRDWVLVLETMLQWEAWLKQPELRVYDVRRFRMKVQQIMALEKKIGNRQKGMGLRTFNFHAALHIADDILNFGVPSNVNTMSNESHHKGSKTAAVHTQRRAKTFDMQCANNLHEMDIISYGMEEIQNGKVPWMYPYNSDKDCEEIPLEEASSIINTGTRVSFFYQECSESFTYKVFSNMKNKHRFKLAPELQSFLVSTMDELGDGVSTLDLFTEHKRQGQIFRASPYFGGKPWRDWVMIDWGNNLILPAQLWMFVNLQEIPEGLVYEPGIYAVVESAEENEDAIEQNMSELLLPYVKETDGLDENGEVKRKFYLVDVESFYEPAVLIPDLGNENVGAYLRLVPRAEWAEQFSEWLGEEHDNLV